MSNEASSSNSREESVVVVRDRLRLLQTLRSNHYLSRYLDLLDRGWRRSGCLLYKPEMERTCCPFYTIRLRASDFVPSKEQLRVCRQMQRFLDGTLEVRKPIELADDPNTSKHTGSSVHHAAYLSQQGMNLSLVATKGKIRQRSLYIIYLTK